MVRLELENASADKVAVGNINHAESRWRIAYLCIRLAVADVATRVDITYSLGCGTCYCSLSLFVSLGNSRRGAKVAFSIADDNSFYRFVDTADLAIQSVPGILEGIG